MLQNSEIFCVSRRDVAIQKYRFTRVIFGAAPSQYLLGAVIRKHVNNYSDSDPKFEKMVKLGFYVDDLNTSVKNRFAEAGFNRPCHAEDYLI